MFNGKKKNTKYDISYLIYNGRKKQWKYIHRAIRVKERSLSFHFIYSETHFAYTVTSGMCLRTSTA